MSANTERPPNNGRSTGESTTAFSRTIDWAIAATLGIFGILVALSGGGLYASASYTAVSDVIQNGEFESDVLTDAEATDILVELGEWGGIGLIITGILLVALGITVAIMHGRARANNAATPAWILGIVGAIVTMFLSFIPFSPVLGGATASHLNADPEASGLGTGTLAGIIGSLPVLIITIFAGFGLFIGTPSELAPAVAVLLAITASSTLLYYLVLSALGGYLGTRLRKYRHGA